MAELKYYVTYGSWNQELMGTDGDAITKAMEEWTKNEKKSPRIVKRVGDQDKQIKEFLKIRNEVKKRLKNL